MTNHVRNQNTCLTKIVEKTIILKNGGPNEQMKKLDLALSLTAISVVLVLLVCALFLNTTFVYMSFVVLCLVVILATIRAIIGGGVLHFTSRNAYVGSCIFNTKFDTCIQN